MISAKGSIKAIALMAGIFIPTTVDAQEYLGEYTGMVCRGLGGTPDSTVTDNANPDPVRGCRRYHKVFNPATGNMDSTEPPSEEKQTCEQPCVQGAQ